MSDQYQDFSRFDQPDVNDWYVVRIRGFPNTTSKKEICDFFHGVTIVNGEDGIHLITCSFTNKPKHFGEAYIELASQYDFELAQTYHNDNLGTRYIEVFPENYENFQRIMSEQNYAHGENILRLRGLPWDSSERDIAEFFKGLNIKQGKGIHIDFDKTGRASGEAFVHFQTSYDRRQALNRNMKKLGRRYIEIFRSTEHQMNRSILLSEQYRSSNEVNRRMKMKGNNRMHPYTRKHDSRNVDRARSENHTDNVHNDSFSYLMISQNSPNLKRVQPNRTSNDNGNRFANQFDGFNQFKQNNSNSNFYYGLKFDNIQNQSNSLQQPDIDRGFSHKMASNNNRFDTSNRMTQKNDNTYKGFENKIQNNSRINEKYCVHLRGLPYYTDEMDIFNFLEPFQPSFCKIIFNKNGKHSGEAKAYFYSFEHARNAMRKDGHKIGGRYIELFFAGNSGKSNNRYRT